MACEVCIRTCRIVCAGRTEEGFLAASLRSGQGKGLKWLVWDVSKGVLWKLVF